ncbi:hypothetical protein H072_6005 [Dactylellina haptotyla CBS 200.50]|uniref:Uncharacterized protein n=1 Tax=Dactylellina haptotyla (strain CBS 200.50) TaxID=1284197 RepID=S8AGB2_DACHA|nr:hypothetical protein H072_6005 [Dactylellina haptotyla CBS 200.50]
MVRVKQRYILFSILYPVPPNGSVSSPIPQSMAFHQPSPTALTRTSLATIIRHSIAHNFGDLGMGQAGGFAVKYFSQATSTGILRITRENFRILWAALTFVRELYGQPAVIKVVRVSGTIRKAEKEALKLAEDTIRRVKNEHKAMGGSKSGRGIAAIFAAGKSGGKVPQKATVEDEDEDEEMIVDIVDSENDDDDDD